MRHPELLVRWQIDGGEVVLAKLLGDFGVDEVKVGLADDFTCRRAQQPFDFRVAEQVGPMNVFEPYRVRYRSYQGAEEGLPILSLFLCLTELRRGQSLAAHDPCGGKSHAEEGDEEGDPSEEMCPRHVQHKRRAELHTGSKE